MCCRFSFFQQNRKKIPCPGNHNWPFLVPHWHRYVQPECQSAGVEVTSNIGNWQWHIKSKEHRISWKTQQLWLKIHRCLLLIAPQCDIRVSNFCKYLSSINLQHAALLDFNGLSYRLCLTKMKTACFFFLATARANLIGQLDQSANLEKISEREVQVRLCRALFSPTPDIFTRHVQTNGQMFVAAMSKHLRFVWCFWLQIH